jgi:hypothetical protein
LDVTKDVGEGYCAKKKKKNAQYAFSPPPIRGVRVLLVQGLGFTVDCDIRCEWLDTAPRRKEPAQYAFSPALMYEM